MQNIIFTDTLNAIPKEFYPIPSSKIMPEWYKDMNSYKYGIKKPDSESRTTATIKRCMPIFDAMTSGYTILTHADMYISQEKIVYYDKEIFDKTGEDVLLSEEKMKDLDRTAPSYKTALFDAVQFHSIEQAPNHPNRNGHNLSYPKWISPWGIKTPKGYSCLFIQPMHRESVFQILPGIVDTDTYTAPVNFPFTLNDSKYEGLVPAGTPIAQVIPFKRDSWKMSMGDPLDLENLKDQKRVMVLTGNRFFDGYKKQFRQEKDYH
jgi:hypothetical protein